MKEITHEEVKKLLIEMLPRRFSNSPSSIRKFTAHDEVIKYVRQQEIKGWLLDLYRDRFSFYNFDEDSDLRKIKALEEELKMSRKMEIKKYVLLDNNNILEISSPNNLNSDDLEYFSKHMTKTSDNILDLVEAGDLVETKQSIMDVEGVIKKDEEFIFYLSYGVAFDKNIIAIYKKQSNGDYKRYSITD